MLAAIRVYGQNLNRIRSRGFEDFDANTAKCFETIRKNEKHPSLVPGRQMLMFGINSRRLINIEKQLIKRYRRYEQVENY